MEHRAAPSHQLFDELRHLAGSGPVVVAHRGDSGDHPENTLEAFASAARLGVRMQEFDVQPTRDGVLVCCHDATLDRTTDAASRLGPGALISQLRWDELLQLDAGSWRAPTFAATKIPTLADALEVITQGDGIALIEHKAGTAASFVETLRHSGRLARCIVQSFDWDFVAACRRLEPQLAVAVLGPTAQHRAVDAAARSAALALGAGMLHWSLRDLTRAQVAATHAAHLLLCTYTTDDEAGLLGGAAMGVDAMCTNWPARALALSLPGNRSSR